LVKIAFASWAILIITLLIKSWLNV
jgi:hypothetical protein